MFESQIIFRQLTVNADFRDSQLACGIRPNTHCVSDIQIQYFNIIYIMQGEGVFIDAAGKRTKVYPGCLLFRHPHESHSIIRRTPWLSFFANGGVSIYDLLVKLNMLPQERVLFIGESFQVRRTLYHYINKMANEPDPYLLLPEFIELVRRLSTQAHAAKEEQANLFLKEAMDYCKVGMSVSEIAEKLYMNPETLRKRFRKANGCSISQYRTLLRVEMAKNGLFSGKSLKEIAAELGYCDEYALSHQFKKVEGVSPSQFKKNLRL